MDSTGPVAVREEGEGSVRWASEVNEEDGGQVMAPLVNIDSEEELRNRRAPPKNANKDPARKNTSRPSDLTATGKRPGYSRASQPEDPQVTRDGLEASMQNLQRTLLSKAAVADLSHQQQAPLNPRHPA